MITIAKIYRRHELTKLIGLQRSSIYRLMNRGEFPRPIRLTRSGKAVGWRAADVEAWIQSRVVSTGANPPDPATSTPLPAP